MRRHSSLFMLYARASLPWIFLLILVMGLAEGILFHFALNRAFAAAAAEGMPLAGMEVVLEDAGVVWAVYAGYLLMVVLQLAFGPWPETSGILLRLRVSHRARFFTQSLYHFLCCCLLWMAQILMAWGLCLLYVERAGPETASNQAIFLAFHRSSLLHTLLPLENGYLWARNLLAVIAVALGLSIRALRKPAFYLELLFIARDVLVFFALGPNGPEPQNMVFDILVSLALTGSVLYNVFRRKGAADDEG